MNAIPTLIERMRNRPDVGVIDEEQSWKLVIPKGGIYVCEITVPHTVLEWFARVTERKSSNDVWSDWMDYSGYGDSPKVELERSMADDIESFTDRVSKRQLQLPLNIYE